MTYYVLDEYNILGVSKGDCVIEIEKEQRNLSLKDNLHSLPVSECLHSIAIGLKSVHFKHVTTSYVLDNSVRFDR